MEDGTDVLPLKLSGPSRARVSFRAAFMTQAPAPGLGMAPGSCISHTALPEASWHRRCTSVAGFTLPPWPVATGMGSAHDSPGRGEPELPASRGSLSAPIPESARSRGEDAPGTQRLAKAPVGQRCPPASPLPALSQHAGSRRSAAAVSLPCSGMRPACKLHARHVHVPLSEATRPRATRGRNRRRPRGTADPHGTLG